MELANFTGPSYLSGLNSEGLNAFTHQEHLVKFLPEDLKLVRCIKNIRSEMSGFKN